MTVSSSMQLQMFFVCIIFGILSGVLFDLLRSIRRIYGGGDVQTTLQDILFLLVYVASGIFLCFLFDEGRIRYYQIMGATFGVLVYGLFFSRFVMKAFCILHKAIIKILVIPFIKLLRLVYSPVKKLNLCLKKMLQRFKRKIKNILSHKKRIKKRLKLL